ncbi:unnamed protein product [Acidithrix sp. C25]|nr:unnamed protein product [Acidithrix sp. C25]
MRASPLNFYVILSLPAIDKIANGSLQRKNKRIPKINIAPNVTLISSKWKFQPKP